jgi:hypothetical protein
MNKNNSIAHQTLDSRSDPGERVRGLSGRLYCVYNETYKQYGENVYKLGRTNDLKKRKNGYTTPFLNDSEYLYHSKRELKNSIKAEKIMFFILKKYRIRDRREFFRVRLDLIKSVIDRIDNFSDRMIDLIYKQIIKQFCPEDIIDKLLNSRPSHPQSGVRSEIGVGSGTRSALRDDQLENDIDKIWEKELIIENDSIEKIHAFLEQFRFIPTNKNSYPHYNYDEIIKLNTIECDILAEHDSVDEIKIDEQIDIIYTEIRPHEAVPATGTMTLRDIGDKQKKTLVAETSFIEDELERTRCSVKKFTKNKLYKSPEIQIEIEFID